MSPAPPVSLRQTPLTCHGHTRPVTFLAFSGLPEEGSSEYYCITACKDGLPMLRQGDTGDWIGTFEGHKGAVWGVDLNRDASRAATGAADFSASVWDALSGSELLSLPHKHIVKTVHFSRDSSKLATGSNDKIIRVFDIASLSKSPLLEFKEAHKGSIKQVLYDMDDRRLISCSDDKTVVFWDAGNGVKVKELSFEGEAIGGIELSRDGSVLTIAHGKNVSFYDTNKMEVTKTVSTPTVVYSASYLPQKNTFVAAGEDFILYKYNYETGEEQDNFKGHFGPVHCVRFSPDGELYASGSEDGTVRLWQTEIGKSYGLWRVIDSVSGAEVTPKSEAVVS
eukprot:TRINITY_DN2685_c0_g1_i1.p1 TRINITY_DN2685_c0_g1~~TRINITY_DN2685_c0_g1_i1.p1  ORF type:complete len:337 (-),score=120.55 TRINITY_DN2685_c0_g1_i1:675-1685(-)